jgi:methylmalonyl-CoA mutase
MSIPAAELDQSRAVERAPLRFVSAASLFDGHDAAINIIRRILQAHGAEVIHLGHNRSVSDIVRAAIQEDADGIAVSSYQGGHNEYFRYMVDMLRDLKAEHIRVVVGGGGTISPDEIAALEAYGIEKIYSPEDGRQMGLDGMIEDVFRRVRAYSKPRYEFRPFGPRDHQQIARTISVLEGSADATHSLETIRRAIAKSERRAPVIGITGTGGAGKSSLNDELLNRFVRHFPDRQIAVVAMDPTRRRSGGALLGDRIRMNSLSNERIFMRSLATRRQHLATSAVLADTIGLLKLAGFDLIVVETAGIGQSDSEIVDLADLSMYVMTSEYGAPSQLEKIDMLDFADFIVINKFEKRGGEDALRDVRKQWRRNHPKDRVADDVVPVFPTIASQFNDAGVNRLFAALCQRLDAEPVAGKSWKLAGHHIDELPRRDPVIPGERVRYLAEIAADGRNVRESIERMAAAASRAQSLREALEALRDAALPQPLEPFKDADINDASDASRAKLRRAYNQALAEVGTEGVEILKRWPARAQAATDEQYRYQVRGREITGENYSETLSHQKIPKIAVPKLHDWGDLLTFLMKENLPGAYPYTAGVYPYRREEEDPTRMFAGEGTPERTNRRFHYLAGGHEATRLSTAFDSTTLYGEDPDERPDIYGRTGNSGVSIATLDDMKRLYSGFDLCAPSTSVSMTINGPAPMILAMFMNTAIDQRVERHLRESGGWAEAQRKIAALAKQRPLPPYRGERPKGMTARRYSVSAISLDRRCRKDPRRGIVAGAAPCSRHPRRTSANTGIFSTEFALRMMGDARISANAVRNFYGLDPASHRRSRREPYLSAAFTGEWLHDRRVRLERGMKIDDCANLSFFQRLDPEYAVIKRRTRIGRGDARLVLRGPRSQMPAYTSRHRAEACTHAKYSSTTSAPRCRRCMRCSTIATACTRTLTMKR